MISKVKNLLSLYKKRLKFKKISYSLNAVDLIIDYAFKSKKKGFIWMLEHKILFQTIILIYYLKEVGMV